MVAGTQGYILCLYPSTTQNRENEEEMFSAIPVATQNKQPRVDFFFKAFLMVPGMQAEGLCSLYSPE